MQSNNRNAQSSAFTDDTDMRKFESRTCFKSIQQHSVDSCAISSSDTGPLHANTSRIISGFTAHASKTNCLRIGPKSGRVIVTGGEDRKVNLWAVGRTSAVLSLSGHSSPVECVCLDWPEELVVAGSSSGSLKLWDLEHAKVIRTLSGHRSSATSVQFHPFGEFFASGSSDCTVRLWDVRRKGCIQTYSGHKNSIDYLEITPDGRWIASVDTDGVVKIWDMTAGKLLHTISGSSESVASLSFSPSEFILATSSLDGNFHIYDLQNFECISSSFQKLNGVSKISFSGDGHTLATSSVGTFDIWKWDRPQQSPMSFASGWSNIVDFKFLSDTNSIIACSVEQSFVEVWAIDITASPKGRKGSAAQSLYQTTKDSLAQVEHTAEQLSTGSVFPSAQLDQQIPSEFFKNATNLTDSEANDNSLHQEKGNSISGNNIFMPPEFSQLNLESNENAATEPIQSLQHELPNSRSLNSLPLYTGYMPSQSFNAPADSLIEQSCSIASSSLNPKQLSGSIELNIQPFTTSQSNTSSYIPACDGNRPLNLDLSRFIKHFPGRAMHPIPLSISDTSSTVSSDQDVIESVLNRHVSMVTVLNTRLENIRLVREVWSENNPKLALDVVCKLEDRSVLVEFLRILNLRPRLLTLEIAVQILPLSCELLFEMYEDYIQIACSTVLLLYKNFSGIIMDTLRASRTPVHTMDMAFEDRLNRCRSCLDGFTQFSQILGEMRKYHGKLGDQIREISTELELFCESAY
ncbi:Katanin p80 WD40 repeat-containing subunit B1 [Batrachochytrium dendrobatidis]